MTFELSFSPEFFHGDGGLDCIRNPGGRPIELCDFDGDARPCSVRAALVLKSDEWWAEMSREVFGCAPEFVDLDTAMTRIRETNTCGTLSVPVDVWIDEEGFFTVDVFDCTHREPDDDWADTITESMGRTAWVIWWMNLAYCEDHEPDWQDKGAGSQFCFDLDGDAGPIYCSECGERLQPLGGMSQAGLELMDAAPDTPPEAKEWAATFILALREANGDLTLSAMLRQVDDEPEGWTDKDADKFGHALVMEAAGHGVSWSDDYPEHGLTVPNTEWHGY